MSASTYFTPIGIMGRGVWLEMLRRKDAYVLFILMVVFLVGIRVVHIAGVEETATATMLLNLALSAAAMAAHILLIFQVARQVPDDVERRTLYVVLAHATTRSQYLLAKVIYSVLAILLVWIVLFGMGWISLADQSLYNGGLLLQLIILQILSLAMLGSWVLLGSIVLPKAVNVLIFSALLLLSAHINRAVYRNEEVADLAQWGVGLLPDFSKLNLITRYTDSVGALTSTEFISLILYALLFTAIPLYIAHSLFQRRSL